MTLDLEAAIDNRRMFDLAEISKNIDFIPLDGSHRDGLVGDIGSIVETKDKFYIRDNGREVLLKVFDRDGKFLRTQGRYGRGPDEFMNASAFAVDYDRDILYMGGTLGDMSPVVIAYDASGRQVVRNDSISGSRIAFFDDRLILSKESPASSDFGDNPDFKSSIGTKVPLLEVFSPDLRHERTVEVTDRGNGTIINDFVGENGRPGFMVMAGARYIMSDNGNALLVKEARNDTVFHYAKGALEPAWLLDMGNYTVPADAFGVNSATKPGDGYCIHSLYESDDYIFITARKVEGYSTVAQMVFDKRNPSEGFSATDGTENKSGLFLDGRPFTPFYVRNNRLVGYISALGIVDGAEGLTNPRLKDIASSMKEESNPVVVVIELK